MRSPRLAPADFVIVAYSVRSSGIPIPHTLNDQPRHMMAGKSIVVVAELTQKKLRGVTYELLTKARELANTLGGSVVALLIGPNASEHIRELAAYGADKLYVARGRTVRQLQPVRLQ